MDYFELKQVLRYERHDSALSELSDSFFDDVKSYVGKLLCETPVDITLYRNVLSCYSEIIERRFSKISSTVHYTFFRNITVNKMISLEELKEKKPLNIHYTEIKFFNSQIETYYKTYQTHYMIQ